MSLRRVKRLRERIVLDLGSGGGIDVLLSAKRVGSTGKGYGLDMTDEMLALARENQRQAGVTNVEFLNRPIPIAAPGNAIRHGNQAARSSRSDRRRRYRWNGI